MSTSHPHVDEQLTEGGLSLHQVRLSYGDTKVLRGIDLKVSAGEYCVVLGPSGSGKSTLLQSIAGLAPPDSGSVSLDGRSLLNVPAKDRDVSLLFQNDQLYPHWTIRRTLDLATRRSPVPHLRDAIEKIAADFSIGEILDRRPDQVSGGQLRRAALAKAILRRPSIALLDEPLDGLDASLRDDFVAMLGELPRHRGEGLSDTAIIHVTHDGNEAMRLADRILILHEGRVVQSGSPEDIYWRPRTLAVAKSLGIPPPNQLPMHWLATQNAEIAVRINEATGGTTSTMIVVRPESVRISEHVDGEYHPRIVDSDFKIPAAFVSTRFVGGLWISRWDLDTLTWTNTSFTMPTESVGDRVELRVKMTDLISTEC